MLGPGLLPECVQLYIRICQIRGATKHRFVLTFTNPHHKRSTAWSILSSTSITAIDTAIAFWGLLLPAGLEGGALSHIRRSGNDDDDDDDTDELMVTGDSPPGWSASYTDLWFEFLQEKGGKGVSKDTWQMFHEFVRTIDARFSNYDINGEFLLYIYIYVCVLLLVVVSFGLSVFCSKMSFERANSGMTFPLSSSLFFTAAWPSTIDDFVEYAKAKLGFS
jgi:hypothetical protein